MALTLALSVTALAALPASAAAPPAPTSLAPQGSAASTPTFSWQYVSGATKYEIQVANGSSFSPAAFDVTTTNTRWVPTARLKQGSTDWRVRAYNSSGVASAWATTNFTVASVAAPAGLAPNGTDLRQPDQPPLLSWTPVPGAASYQVEVDTNNDWINPQFTASVKSPHYVVPSPQSVGLYYWRVAAVLDNGVQTDWAEASYSVHALDPVTFLSPNDSSGTDVEDVALDWAPVPGARSYELRVSTDQNFGTVTDSVTNIIGTRYSPAQTYLNDQYYWEVRAIDRAGVPTAWQPAPWNFRRIWPEQPTQVYPADNDNVGNPFYYQWTPVKHATSYQLDEGTDPNFSPGTYFTCRTASTTYTPALPNTSNCVPGQGQTIYWRVRAMDAPANVEGIYSEIHTFVYDTGSLTQVAPTDGATVAVPTMAWQPFANAEQYYVEVKNASGTVVASKTTFATSWTPDALLSASGSPFTWTVQAVFDGGAKSVKYPGHQFILGGSVPTTGAAALTPLSGTAADDPTVRVPSLTWEPMTGASYYKLHVSETPGYELPSSTSPLLSTKFHYPAATDTASYFMKPGSYTWRVEGFDASNVSMGLGSPATFTINDLAPVTGQAIALNGSTLDASGGCAKLLVGATASDDHICRGVPSTPVLSWDPTPGAGYYLVYLSNDQNFTNRVYTQERTTNTRWTPSLTSAPVALPDTQAGQAYYWMVRPCKASGICGPDPVSASTSAATNGFAKTSPAVRLVSPSADAIATSSEVTFNWQDYYDTNTAHTTYADTSEAGIQTAKQYQIQVTTSSACLSSAVVDDQTVDQTTYAPWRKTYPEGDLWWHVRALDAAGNPLPWSECRHFSKRSDSTPLVSPANGAAVSGSTSFQWKSRPLDSTYAIEIYKNNDTNLSSVNRVVSASGLRQQAYVPSSPLPASSLAYLWRVRRTDAGGQLGQWSALSRFYSRGSVPALSSPGAGAWVAPTSALFRWSPVTDALSYRVEIRAAGAASNLQTATTKATAWAPTSSLPQGSFTWHVTALDVAGQPLGTSADGTFKIDTVHPTVTYNSPTTTAYRTANFTAKFSERVTNVNSSTVKLYVAGRVSPLTAAVTLSSDGRTAVLNPSANMVVGKYYTVKVLSSIRDVAGNGLVAMSWRVRAK